MMYQSTGIGGLNTKTMLRKSLKANAAILNMFDIDFTSPGTRSDVENFVPKIEGGDIGLSHGFPTRIQKPGIVMPWRRMANHFGTDS
jgi:hypothetical protein